jgi:hypothetical protein
MRRKQQIAANYQEDLLDILNGINDGIYKNKAFILSVLSAFQKLIGTRITIKNGNVTQRPKISSFNLSTKSGFLHFLFTVRHLRMSVISNHIHKPQQQNLFNISEQNC